MKYLLTVFLVYYLGRIVYRAYFFIKTPYLCIKYKESLEADESMFYLRIPECEEVLWKGHKLTYMLNFHSRSQGDVNKILASFRDATAIHFHSLKKSLNPIRTAKDLLMIPFVFLRNNFSRKHPLGSKFFAVIVTAAWDVSLILLGFYSEEVKLFITNLF